MKELICIVCPNGCHLQVDEENGFQVTGHGIKPHYHPWQDGHPVRTLNKKGKYENEGRPLDESKVKILHKVRNYGN